MRTYDCEGCGRAVTTQETIYQLQTGWSRVNPPSQSLRMRRKENRFLCRSCLDAMEMSGTSWQQLSLIEEKE